MGHSDERSTPLLTGMPGRRDFLRGIALTGVAATAGGLLAGCSTGSKGSAGSTSTSTPASAGKPKRAEQLGDKRRCVEPREHPRPLHLVAAVQVHQAVRHEP